MRLGIGSWTYPWGIGFAGYPAPEKPMGAIDLINMAKRLGVGVVQICDNLPLHEMSAAELLELRQVSEEVGISLQIGTRGVGPEHLLRYLDIAKIVNAKLLRTITDTPDSKPSLQQAVQWIKEVIPEFEKEGVCIAVENHDRFKARELAWMIQKIDSPNTGICLDTVNSFGALEGPEFVIAELSPYTVNLHIKDFDITRIDNKMGFTIQGSPAGYGRLDAAMILEEIRKKGRNPDVILEQWTPFEQTVEKTIQREMAWAEKGIEYLKDKIKNREGEN